VARSESLLFLIPYAHSAVNHVAPSSHCTQSGHSNKIQFVSMKIETQACAATHYVGCIPNQRRSASALFARYNHTLPPTGRPPTTRAVRAASAGSAPAVPGARIALGLPRRDPLFRAEHPAAAGAVDLLRLRAPPGRQGRATEGARRPTKRVAELELGRIIALYHPIFTSYRIHYV
jgi:hypothetical protein